MEKDINIFFPDGTISTLMTEAKHFAMDYVCHFFKALLKNKKIDLGLNIFPLLHNIASIIAAMYYQVTNQTYKDNAMSVL